MRGSRRSMRGSGRSVGGQGVVIGDHLEVRCSLLTLPKAMSISRSEILRKKKEKRKKRPENEKSRKVMGAQWEVKGWSLDVQWNVI